MANEIFNHQMTHIYNENGKIETIDSSMNDPKHELWNQTTSNKFEWLTQGKKYSVAFANTLNFIPKTKVSTYRNLPTEPSGLTIYHSN